MANKINKTVVRNAAYKAGEFGLRERHNERQNESYMNGDIDKSRADMNIHFRQNFADDGSVESYEQTFNRLLDEGKIVKRGLKPDAKVFDELVFDVNTAYFDEVGEELGIGGYEYAKMFFAEAYRLAVKEVGSEDYILSAVLHADERNKALSEDLGRDIYHYHLHVVYVPVVQKEIKWSKRTKDKSLVGKVKEVIPQISHSKKWPMRMLAERDGKTVQLNAYSLLQDRFFEHMREAGFEGFEHGERGSTSEHLSDLEYKTMKERERLALAAEKTAEQEQAAFALQAVADTLQATTDTLQSVANERQRDVDALFEKANAEKKRLEQLQRKINLAKKEVDIFAEIDQMGADVSLFGKVQLSKEDWDNISALAKEGQRSRSVIQRLRAEVKKLLENIAVLEKRLGKYEAGQLSISDTMQYYEALQRAPERLREMLADIMREPAEHRSVSQYEKQKHKNHQQEVR